MYYFFPGPPIYELEAEKLMGNSLGGVHTHDMLVFIVNLIVWLENHPPVQRCSSLPVLYRKVLFWSVIFHSEALRMHKGMLGKQ